LSERNSQSAHAPGAFCDGFVLLFYGKEHLSIFFLRRERIFSLLRTLCFCVMLFGNAIFGNERKIACGRMFVKINVLF
jgi:hypothetical protein